jgi:chloramphenicol-sensitive protein RarD
MEREQMRGLQAAVTAYVLWGLFTIYWKQLVSLNPFELIGWRVVSASVVMTLYMRLTGGWPAVRGALSDRATATRIVVSALLLTGNWLTYVWAIVNSRVIETALGYFLAPLGTMAIGVFVLGERSTRLKRWSVVFALAAVAVLTVSYGELPWIAVVLAFTWSVYGLTKRRVPLEAAQSLAAETLVLIIPAIIIVAAGWWRDDGVPHVATGVEWGFLLGTGVVTMVPLVLFAFAAKRVPFTLLGPTNYLVPIITFLLGWLVYDEPLTKTMVAGFALVWVALTLVTLDTLRPAQPAKPEPVASPGRRAFR